MDKIEFDYEKYPDGISIILPKTWAKSLREYYIPHTLVEKHLVLD